MFNDTPEKIYSSIRINEPNEEIVIYEGKSQLVIHSNKIELQHIKITFNWLPEPRVFFKSKFTPKSHNEIKLVNESNLISIIIDGLKFGEGYFSNIEYSNQIYLDGQIESKAILGDKSIDCDEIDFILPNLRFFIGDSIQIKREGTIFKGIKGRIHLEDEKYNILLDQVEDYNKNEKLIQVHGGYMQLYDGKITRKDKKQISFTEINILRKKLEIFLSFINGRKVSPILLTGKFKGRIIWQDFSPISVSSYKACKTWTIKHPQGSFKKFWSRYYSFIKNKENEDALNTVIHWYLEANNNSGGFEGSLIMAQTALELLYNWIVVEKEKVILGSDSENIKAANKIRLLLKIIKGIEIETPISYVTLNKFISENKQINDIIDAIVLIRNWIVHSQSQKRKQLSKIDSKAKLEALDFSIWLIEICLLRIIGYQGKLKDRSIKNYLDITDPI